jgi:hypothetical protein
MDCGVGYAHSTHTNDSLLAELRAISHDSETHLSIMGAVWGVQVKIDSMAINFAHLMPLSHAASL